MRVSAPRGPPRLCPHRVHALGPVNKGAGSPPLRVCWLVSGALGWAGCGGGCSAAWEPKGPRCSPRGQLRRPPAVVFYATETPRCPPALRVASACVNGQSPHSHPACEPSLLAPSPPGSALKPVWGSRAWPLQSIRKVGLGHEHPPETGEKGAQSRGGARGPREGEESTSQGAVVATQTVLSIFYKNRALPV